MIAHTVTSFDEDLKSLDSKILRMGGLAEHQLTAALSAIAHADPEEARQAIASDAAIDTMQREIEDLAVHIIAIGNRWPSIFAISSAPCASQAI